jgi:hypothetical protein
MLNSRAKINAFLPASFVFLVGILLCLWEKNAMNKNQNELLDELLKYFKVQFLNNDGTKENKYNQWVSELKLEAKAKELKIESYIKDALIEVLLNDKYIRINLEKEEYQITGKGILFIENEGYVKVADNLDVKERHSKLMEKIASQTHIQIAKLTCWASLAAVGLLIVAILTFYYDCHK